MKDKDLKNILSQYGEDDRLINQMVVSCFVEANHLSIKDDFLAGYILPTSDLPLYSQLEIESLEDVIRIFELAIPQCRVVENGAVYTPSFVREEIVKRSIERCRKQPQSAVFADIACGCGAFLITIAEQVKGITRQPYCDIFDRITGIDISFDSIERCKILIALFCLVEGETIDVHKLHLYTANTLSFDFTTSNAQCYDVIVGNPPYVRSKHLEIATKTLMKKWTVSRCGNSDLYIPFFQIALEHLKEGGCMGFITVNSFFKAVNARLLRSYLSDGSISMEILNFGEELIFKGKLAYTCLFFATKKKDDTLRYAKISSAELKGKSFPKMSSIILSGLDNKKGWLLNQNNVREKILKIESIGNSLGDTFSIKNGIATLANGVFIFKPEYEDERFYYISSNGVNLPIEKSICKSIIKPNILKSEDEIGEKLEKVIFPYDKEFKVLEEDFFASMYPKAYEYLTRHKDVLLSRDKGENKGKYQWYEFGRSQAISYRGKKLMFPYMTDSPHFVYTNDEDMLIYCGYAIYHESDFELNVLKRILESSVFDFYIKNTSKPYAMGFLSYAKNYVKSFGIYPFTIEEKKELLSIKDKGEIDNFILRRYFPLSNIHM